jgi:hypothetical protein
MIGPEVSFLGCTCMEGYYAKRWNIPFPLSVGMFYKEKLQCTVCNHTLWKKRRKVKPKIYRVDEFD